MTAASEVLQSGDLPRAGAGPTVSAARGAGLAFFLSLMAANVGNFAFHLVAGRLLGPADYGVLGPLLLLMAALAVPAGVVETLVSAQVARNAEHGIPTRFGSAMRRGLWTGAAVAGLVALCAPVLTDFLHLSSPLPVLAVALFCIPMCAVAVPWGFLCGNRRFGLAGAVALLTAVCRLGFGILALLAGFGLVGALLAIVAAEVARTGLLWAFAARLCPDVPAEAERRPLRVEIRTILGGTAAVAALQVLVGMDAMLARHYLPEAEAGQYTAASTAVRGVFFASQALCALGVPLFASDDLLKSRRAYLWVCLGTVALGASATAVLWGAGPGLLTGVFGHAFAFQSSVLIALGATATGLSLLWVLIQYRVARGERAGMLAPLMGVAVVAAMSIVWHPHSLGVALATATGVGASLTLGLAVMAFPKQRREVVPAPTMPPADLDLTIVVPYHNPGPLLRPNLERLLSVLGEADIKFEVIAVADGCTDDSPSTVSDLDANLVRHIVVPENRGKGAALRTGLGAGRGRYLGFIDADGDLDPELFKAFLELVRVYEPDLVIGSKHHPMSSVAAGQTPARRMCSLGYHALVGLAFPFLPVRDTQVGVKLFRRELLADALPLTRQNGFVFDLELIVVAWAHGHRRIMPAPIVLNEKQASTVRPRTVWWMFWQSLAVAREFYRGAYRRADRPDHEAALAETGDRS